MSIHICRLTGQLCAKNKPCEKIFRKKIRHPPLDVDIVKLFEQLDAKFLNQHQLDIMSTSTILTTEEAERLDKLGVDVHKGFLTHQDTWNAYVGYYQEIDGLGEFKDDNGIPLIDKFKSVILEALEKNMDENDIKSLSTYHDSLFAVCPANPAAKTAKKKTKNKKRKDVTSSSKPVPAKIKKPRKKRRSKPGTKAVREIRAQQNRTDLIMPKAPFVRVVKGITEKNQIGRVRWTANALEALQWAAEDHVIEVLQKANETAVFVGKRKTLQKVDIQVYCHSMATALPKIFRSTLYDTNGGNEISKDDSEDGSKDDSKDDSEDGSKDDSKGDSEDDSEDSEFDPETSKLEAVDDESSDEESDYEELDNAVRKVFSSIRDNGTLNSIHKKTLREKVMTVLKRLLTAGEKKRCIKVFFDLIEEHNGDEDENRD